MNKYNILWADSPENLDALVNGAMERGEIPVGGIALQTFGESEQCGPTKTIATLFRL